MDEPEQRDQPVESGALEPEGEGERMPGPRQDEPVESGALEDVDEDEDEAEEGDADYDTPQSPNKGRLPTTGSETGGFSGAQVTDFRPGRAEPTPLADDEGEEREEGDERD